MAVPSHLGLRGLLRSGIHTDYEHNRAKAQDRAADFVITCLQGAGGSGQP
ncbi:MAG: hypothetical protein ACRDYE_09570 [Acidimicrobiales bacterium]